MKDKELKYNASGDYDEPCYKTMTAPPKPGEIWTHSVAGYSMLVIANQGNVYSILRLKEKEKEGMIPVMGRAQMYTSPIMLGYCFRTGLGDFVKSVKQEEFTDVRLAVVDALGLKDASTLSIVAAVPHDHINALEGEVRRLEKKCQDLHNDRCAFEEKANTLKEQRDKLMEEIGGYGETIKRQADELQANSKQLVMMGNELKAATLGAEKTKVYKELYESMMDRMMKLAMRGGAYE